MTAGFRIVNDNSVTQIDELYQNLVFYKKTAAPTVSYSTAGVNEPLWICTWVKYTTRDKTGVLAFNSIYYAAPVIITENTSNYTYYFAVYNAPIGYVFTIYEFAAINAATSPGLGIEVFKADGTTVTYSSMYKYMKVVNFQYENNDSGSMTLPKTITLPTGKTYAVCVSMGCGYTATYDDGNNNWENEIVMRSVQMITGGIRINEPIVMNQITTVPIHVRGNATFTCLTLDVTGY